MWGFCFFRVLFLFEFVADDVDMLIGVVLLMWLHAFVLVVSGIFMRYVIVAVAVDELDYLRLLSRLFLWR